MRLVMILILLLLVSSGVMSIHRHLHQIERHLGMEDHHE